MPALSYTECEIDTGALATHAETFQELHAKISGRSGEFNTIAEPVAMQFEGLVGEGLKSVAVENQEAWSSAMMACIHAYGIIQKVISDVEWYENEIEAIKVALSVALGGMPSTGSEEDDASLKTALVAEHNTQAREAWEKLETKCESTEDRLREGPTPENIRELIEAGHLGSGIAYSTTGDVGYFYFEESDAVTMANFFKTAVEGHDGSVNALDGQLALLNAFVLRALEAQRNGEKLSDNEIAFLDALFAELEIDDNQVEQMNGESTPQDFLTFIDELSASEYIDEQTKSDIKRNLANSMLFLSDEDLGGGMDMLPQDVREAAVGPSYSTNDFTYEYNDWVYDFTSLSDLLSHTGPGVQGGNEFSVSLLGTSAQMLAYADEKPVGMEYISHNVFGEIIETASRNEEANYILLTGEDFEGDTYQHHENHQGLTTDSILRTFYTHDWDDGGAAVSGLTDWIATNVGQEIEGITDEIRGTALAELMKLMEDEGFRNDLFGTGERAEDEDGVVWLNVTAGQLNPELADGFGDIFLAYMESFAETNGVGDDREIETSWNEEKGRIDLSPESRLAFTQLIMGDPDAAERIYKEVLLNSGEVMTEYATNTGERSHIPTALAGSLQGLVEEALENESEGRETRHDNAADHMKKVHGSVVDILGGTAGDAGVPGIFVEIAKAFAKESLEFPTHPAEENVETPDDWKVEEDLKGITVSVLAEANPEIMDAIEETYGSSIVKVDENGKRYIPTSHGEWDIEQSSRGVLGTIYDDYDQMEWADGEGNVENAVYNFLANFGAGRDAWGIETLE